MRSSTSNSDASQTPFVGRAVLALSLAIAIPVVAAALSGLAYHPQPISPTRAEIDASDSSVLLFGNSRFEAGLPTEVLAKNLKSTVRAFTGGGWDVIHYYQLALLSADLLRADRDIVIFEISPLSLNDAVPSNRLGAIRREAAWSIATLPGAPIETRLDVLLGAVASAYRYRPAIQSVLLAPRAERVADSGLSLLGALGMPPVDKGYRLVTAPGRDFVIERIDGDVASFTATHRPALVADLSRLRVGGFKMEALRRAVQVLRARKIHVFLVEVPTSSWLHPKLHESESGRTFDANVTRLASDSGAHLLKDWPQELASEKYYWDDEHMIASTGARFSTLLADRIRETLGDH